MILFTIPNRRFVESRWKQTENTSLVNVANWKYLFLYFLSSSIFTGILVVDVQWNSVQKHELAHSSKFHAYSLETYSPAKKNRGTLNEPEKKRILLNLIKITRKNNKNKVGSASFVGTNKRKKAYASRCKHIITLLIIPSYNISKQSETICSAQIP